MTATSTTTDVEITGFGRRRRRYRIAVKTSLVETTIASIIEPPLYIYIYIGWPGDSVGGSRTTTTHNNIICSTDV